MDLDLTNPMYVVWFCVYIWYFPLIFTFGYKSQVK